MDETLKMEMCGLSDPGEVRQDNEDAIRWNAQAGWAVLADGMGGHMAGEVASAIAVETLEQYLNAISRDAMPDEVLREAVSEANRRIHAQAASDIRCHNMGTTVVAMLVRGGALHCAHVGDSRLYRYRNGELQQLSHDHSLVQELVDEGMLSVEEAAESSHKNVITRALGLEATVQVDTLHDAVQSGDRYLLCSDGLSDKIADEELGGYLAEDALEAITHSLVAEANRRGGEDNISVILVGIGE